MYKKQDLVNLKDLFFFHRRKYKLGFGHLNGIDCHSFTVFTFGIYCDAPHYCQPFLLGCFYIYFRFTYLFYMYISVFLHVNCVPHACLVHVEVKKKTLDP